MVIWVARERRSDATAHRQADEALAAAQRRRRHYGRRRSAAVVRRLAHGPGQSVLRQGRGQPHLGAIDGPRHRRAGRRFPRFESAVERGPAGRAGQGFRQTITSTSKHAIRTILNSRTYQLSCRKNEFNKDDVKYFSHARTRLLTAEQLLDAICQVTGVEEKYAGLPQRHAGHAIAQPRRRQLLPEGLRPAGSRNGLPVRTIERIEPVASLADDQRSAGPHQGARRGKSLAQAGVGLEAERRDRSRIVSGRVLPGSQRAGNEGRRESHQEQRRPDARAGRRLLGTAERQ